MSILPSLIKIGQVMVVVVVVVVIVLVPEWNISFISTITSNTSG
jgi:hypothetical protein